MSLLAPALLASKVWKLGVGWATWVRCFPLSLSYARVRVGIQLVRVSPLRLMQEKSPCLSVQSDASQFAISEINLMRTRRISSSSPPSSWMAVSKSSVSESAK